MLPADLAIGPIDAIQELYASSICPWMQHSQERPLAVCLRKCHALFANS